MRRLIITAIATLTLAAGASGAQALGGYSPSAGGYWGCVGSETLDKGICLRNPVPERLPVPAVPTT